MDKPKVDGAPGLVWRERKDFWVAEWHCRSDLAKRGFRPPSARLWAGTVLDSTIISYIRDQCQRLQTEMLVWGRGGLPTVSMYDGTLKQLIACYQKDEAGGYRKLRYRTRQGYDSLCRAIDQDHGEERVADIRARDLIRWHEEWAPRGTAMAHSLMGMLRTLFRFGVDFLEDSDCGRLQGFMSRQRFKMAKQRSERITAEQVIAIRGHAHKQGLHSLALAQAIQFELMLRQKDVIGEWVPLSEPGASEITAGGSKWLRGLRWSEIDQNLVLRHTTSKRQKDIEVSLKLAPMVMDELSAVLKPTELKSAGSSPVGPLQLPSSGPMIVCEATGIPYVAHQFRYYWRKVAKAAGVPDSVYNMDSRAGAISEATDAGADLEHVRHAATHSDIGMTQRYSRGDIEKTANVMKLRVAHRNKAGK